jgi:hypothetical protein
MINMSKEEAFFKFLVKVIALCQEIQNDSRTPLEDALALTPLIRQLVSSKRELHRKAFTAAAVNAEYENAAALLKELNAAVKAEVLAHKQTMEFIRKTADTAAAVLKLAEKAAKVV